jgi:hypothetical protein
MRPSGSPARSGGTATALLLAFAASCSPGDAFLRPHGADGLLLPDLEQFSGLGDRPRSSASSGFWDWWGDGRAELSGYRVTVPRYREPREGTLALIYVTEPHDRRSWIKDDDAERPHRVEVLKLIRAFHFLTGIYPYSVTSSVFSPVDRWVPEPFHPVRINLDVQEWCGAVSHRVWPGEGRVRSLRLSYFASEGETLREIPVPEGTVFEDALLIQLRELDGPFQEGGDWEGWLVPELWSLRTGHGPVEPVRASITRSSALRDGTPITRFVLEAGPYQRIFEVEAEAPRRVLAWETSTGERAELLGTQRLAYWSLNRPGDEEVREALGLPPLQLLPGPGGAGCVEEVEQAAVPGGS